MPSPSSAPFVTVVTVEPYVTLVRAFGVLDEATAEVLDECSAGSGPLYAHGSATATLDAWADRAGDEAGDLLMTPPLLHSRTSRRRSAVAPPAERLERRVAALELVGRRLDTALALARQPVHEPEPQRGEEDDADDDRGDEAEGEARAGILATPAGVGREDEHVEEHVWGTTRSTSAGAHGSVETPRARRYPAPYGTGVRT